MSTTKRLSSESRSLISGTAIAAADGCVEPPSRSPVQGLLREKRGLFHGYRRLFVCGKC